MSRIPEEVLERAVKFAVAKHYNNEHFCHTGGVQQLFEAALEGYVVVKAESVVSEKSPGQQLYESALPSLRILFAAAGAGQPAAWENVAARSREVWEGYANGKGVLCAVEGDTK